MASLERECLWCPFALGFLGRVPFVWSIVAVPREDSFCIER